MNQVTDNAPRFAFLRTHARLGLSVLLCMYAVVCCASLVYVADFYALYKIFWFEQARLIAAMGFVVPFAAVSLVFVFARFSFGYFVGFYFYTMVLGYLWLAQFSRFHGDHTMASISAFASALAFFVPALFIIAPIKQALVLSDRALDNLLSGILIFAAAVIAAGAFYNFRLVGFTEIYEFRGQFEFPAALKYAIGATSNALLPFAFACFVARRNHGRATASLLLLLLIYPVTLTKLTLFAPFWLLALALLSRLLEARIIVVLSMFLLVSVGVVLAMLVRSGTLAYVPPVSNYFATINLRMFAFPSVALDVYGDFFATHEHTHFCQIQFLKPLMSCPYNEYLSVIMAKAYQLGNLNASLFATEGIASVGPVLAPLAVFGCGLVIALANRLSSGLPSEFILVSGGVLPQVFLNVPLTTTLLTNGAAILFLLWYITPRAMLARKARDKPAFPP